MKILNFGSLNFDYVYKVNHFVQEGETIAASNRNEFCGGKGLNQSIALSKAGAHVYHAGCCGADGTRLIQILKENHVDIRYVEQCSEPTGHAIIQLTPEGKNCIMIYGGANQSVTKEHIDHVFNDFGAEDILLLQNETSCRDYAIERAHDLGMYVVLNPSPISDDLLQSNALKKVDMFILNEVEGYELTHKKEPKEICGCLREKYQNCSIVLTLGEHGVIFDSKNQRLIQKALKVSHVVDTTAAGDTFTGYFLSRLSEGNPVSDALLTACRASAIAITRRGASDSIPVASEVELFAENEKK